ncbi:MAG: hypothetical protein IJT18_08430 [Oscillospiraceae bacterium]|nr:hypothetical protein [Oscillospiraceae bacterium]
MKLTLGLVIAVCVVLAISFVFGAFGAQYNANGVSSLLNVSIDRSQPRQFAGTLGESDVFVEQMDPDALYFVAVDAKRIPLKDALAQELVSLEDWRKKARHIDRDGDAEILRYENYEIELTGGECTIRPRS